MENADFEDSGAAWEELSRFFEERTKRLKQVALQLYRSGLGGVFIPVFSFGPGVQFIVGSAPELRALKESPEAMLRAINRGKPLAQWEPLVEPVREALDAGGRAEGAAFRLGDVGSDVHVVVGTLEVFCDLVETLKKDDGD